jgi:hypothetical protein
MPAHPVGHEEQVRIIFNEERVLVVLPLPPDVGETVCLHVHP